MNDPKAQSDPRDCGLSPASPFGSPSSVVACGILGLGEDTERRLLQASAHPAFFAQILVEEGILDTGRLRELVRQQQETCPQRRQPIAFMALERGWLTGSSLMALLDQHGHRMFLGELLVLRRAIELAELEQGLREQAAHGGLLGDHLIRLGLLSGDDLASALAAQAGVAYIPISHIPIDPDVARWVNAGFARLHALVPVSQRGRTLSVAIAHPRALAAAADIEQASGLRVTVFLSTIQEVAERIEAIYTGSRSGVAA